MDAEHATVEKQPQPRHEVLSPFPGNSYIELRFPSEEMAMAYSKWMQSGEAHKAFVIWQDAHDE